MVDKFFRVYYSDLNPNKQEEIYHEVLSGIREEKEEEARGMKDDLEKDQFFHSETTDLIDANFPIGVTINNR